MEAFLIILCVFAALYLFPTVRLLSKDIILSCKLRRLVREKNYKKYGSCLPASRFRTSFYIETEDTLYSVIVFRDFYKYMLFFDLKGNVQVRRIGARRLIPFRPFYSVDISHPDFFYKSELLPASSANKRLIPILLLNPSPSGINIPSPFKTEVSIGAGEFIDDFYVSNRSYFLKLLSDNSVLH